MTVLAVANVGGHLDQLVELVPRMGFEEPIVWVTSDNAQSRSLLEGETVRYLGYPQARSVHDAAVNMVRARSLFHHQRPTCMVTTGASLAVSVMPLAAARGIPVHYVESATRVDGPSISGRVASILPGARLYTQHQRWADGRWAYRGSVFDGFTVTAGAPGRVGRVVVSVGSSSYSGFPRLVRHLAQLLPPDVEVLWQCDLPDVPEGVNARPRVPAAELHAAMAEADAVVVHAGTGSSLAALRAGRLPVVAPRLPTRGEHVDDHQLQIARFLADRGLALVRDADRVSMADLASAATFRVRREDPGTFVLTATPSRRPAL